VYLYPYQTALRAREIFSIVLHGCSCVFAGLRISAWNFAELVNRLSPPPCYVKPVDVPCLRSLFQKPSFFGLRRRHFPRRFYRPLEGDQSHQAHNPKQPPQSKVISSYKQKTKITTINQPPKNQKQTKKPTHTSANAPHNDFPHTEALDPLSVQVV